MTTANDVMAIEHLRKTAAHMGMRVDADCGMIALYPTAEAFPRMRPDAPLYRAETVQSALSFLTGWAACRMYIKDKNND